MAKTLCLQGREVVASTPAELVTLWSYGARGVDGSSIDPTDISDFTTEAPAPVAADQNEGTPPSGTTDD